MDNYEIYQNSRQELFEEHKIQPRSIKIKVKDGPVEQVHYMNIGSGRPMILLHGGGSHASEFIPLLKPLSEQFELFVVDRPGCGLTDLFHYKGVDVPAHAVSFIRSFMDAVGLDHASFLAQSMGGYFAIRFAMEYPKRVEKLILIGAPAGMNLKIPLLLRLLGTPGINRVVANTVGRPRVSGIRDLHKQLFMADVSRVSTAFLRHCRDHQKLPGTFRSFQTLLENVLTFRGWRRDLYIGDRLQELKMPVHFIWGGKDAFESAASGAAKARSIPDHTFTTIADAGHCPWLDKPLECARAVVEVYK